MNALVDTWGSLVFHGAWQAAVVAAIILVAVRLGRRWPAPIGYGLLLVALAKFALPPILASPSGVFSCWGPQADAVEQVAATSVSAAPTDPRIGSTPAGFEIPSLDDASPEPAMAILEPVEIRQVASSLSAVPQTTRWNWKAALLVVHLLGMAAVAAWLAVQWLRLRTLRTSSSAIADEGIRDRFRALACKLRLHRSVRLLVGSESVVPCSFGLLRPVVIVPKSLIREPSDDLDRVLAHELAHHRRGDLWVNAVQLVLFAVWWFHPLYWLLHRSLRATREDCCDDLLLAKGIALPGEYCDTILRVASSQGSAGPLAIASSMADYHHPLEKRFRRIMDRSLRRSVRLGWLGLAAVVVLAAVLLPGARGSSETDKEAVPGTEVKPAESIDEPAEPDETRSNETPRMGEPRAIVGRVVDESGKPVAGAKLWLPVRWRPDGWLVAQGTVDDRGRFRIEVPGKWMTESDIHEYFFTIWTYAPGHRIAITSAQEGLFAETLKPVEVVLGAEVRTSVRVLKPDGSPAVGATVKPSHFRGIRGYEIVPEELVELIRATSDESGLARLPALPCDGLDNLDIETQGFGRQRIQTDPSLVEDVPWKIELRPTGRVVGRIVADDADTAAGVRLRLQTEGQLEYPRTTMPPWMTEGHSVVVTDKQGRFEAENLAEGILRIRAEFPGEGAMRLSIPEWLEVAGGETTEVTLEVQRGVLVEGTVQEHRTGKPVAGAQVAINHDNESRKTRTTTDDLGRYSAYTLCGNAWFQVLAKGYTRTRGEPHQSIVEIPDNVDRFEIPVFELVPTREVSGRLIDHKGRGVSEVRLEGYSGDEPHGQSSILAGIEGDGAFRIRVPRDVTLQEMAFVVSGVGFQPTKATMQQEEPLVLRLKPPLTRGTGTVLVGRVIDKHGEPVEDAAFQLNTRRDENDRGSTLLRTDPSKPAVRTDSEGRFRIPEFLHRDWQYQVSVKSKLHEMLNGTSQWTTAIGSETDLGDIVVERHFSVRGRIVDEDERPITGAVATLHDHDDPMPVGVSDKDGRFAFPRVFGVGRFNINVMADGYAMYHQLTEFTEEDGRRADSGPRIVLVRREAADSLELLRGVEQVRTAFPRPVLMQIEAHYKDSRLHNVHRNEVLMDGNRYRFRGISADRVNARSIFDGEQILNYDGDVSCTIRPPSKHTADYLFDPRTLGLTTVLQPAKDVAACLAYREAKEIRLIGDENISGRDASHVRVIDKFDQQLDFWIEMPHYRVTRSEYRLKKIYRVAISRWGDLGVFPEEVTTKTYLSERLISEATLKILKWAETGELSSDTWTLAGLDLPVGTPVVRLFGSSVDKAISGRNGYWDGKGLSNSPGRRAASD